MVKCFLLVVVLSGVMCAQVPSPEVATPSATPKPPFPANSLDTPVENIALLPSLPPVPQGKTTVLGGNIDKLDRVRDELTLKIFGGGRTRILFDGRTRIYLADMSAGHRGDLRDGQRVHMDTMLDGIKVFARSVYILPQAPVGESYGQIVSYRPATGELMLRESLSATMKLQLLSSTVIQHQGRPISPMALPMGSLVSVTFLAEGDGRAVVREISVLAEPGDSFEFTGRIVHLDLHVELMVLEDFHDQKSYEIHFDRSLISARDNFREGANVTVLIVYDGTRYKARTLTVNPSSSK